MAYANGRLPHDVLAKIPGSSPRPGGQPLLREDAAIAYRALHDYSMRRWGISMALYEGAVRQAYRELDAQYLARRIYGGNAAVPGTSNHGLGINVDLETRQQRWVIDQVGHLFGFSKRWSDASWEWWHITYRAGRYEKVEEYKRRVRGVRYGDKGKRVKWIQYRLIAHGYKRGWVKDHGWLRVPRKGDKGRGYFGKATRSAVRKFQRDHKLRADGVVGPMTRTALKRRPT